MLQTNFRKHTLQFINPGGTSRGVLHEKDSWFIELWNDAQPDVVGVGEVSVIPRLSIDDVPELEETIAQTLEQIALRSSFVVPERFPAIRFALETALLDWQGGGQRLLFPSAFTRSEAAIPINGLIWIGSFDNMWQQAEAKYQAGFRVLKTKIGALNFDEELYFVKQLRGAFPDIELRLDANGAFAPDEALDRLQALSEHRIHSIEQPIKPRMTEKMNFLCRHSPIAVALDEELIGLFSKEEKERMLMEIRPQYIILKPSLIGGFTSSDEWIDLAAKHSIGWWATSALESNIGLNAIAQWTFTKRNPLPQGLGTGSVFSNNVDMPLAVANGELKMSER